MTEPQRNTARTLIKFGVLLIGMHILFAMIFFSLFCTKFVNEMMMRSGSSPAIRFIFLYGISVFLILFIYYAYTTVSDPTFGTQLKAAAKKSDFSINRYFRDNYLKINLYRIILFAVFQLPFVIFYAIFGYSISAPTSLENFYRLEAGIYMTVKYWWLGFILTTLIFALFLLLTQWVAFRIKYRDIIRNAPSETFERHE